MLEPIPLSVSLAGLDPSPGLPWSGGARAPIRWASGLGAGRVRLDGSAPGLRARELDRGARRDLAGLLRRSELVLSGIDLWIPEAHFCDPARVDRAAGACITTIGLASELAGLSLEGSPVSVSIQLPQDPAPGVVGAIEQAAASAGVVVADHGTGACERTGSIGAGLDPASVLMGGDEPSELALKASIVSARLSDSDSAGRCPVGGRGRLDVRAYAGALSVGGYAGDVVIDLRGLVAQDENARQAMDVWKAQTALPG